MKDLFSQQAGLYARYRPVYPPKLFEFVLRHVRRKDSALDCATGNGQVARVLAKHFRKVCGIDISKSQLSHAERADNIEYSVSRAEQTPFADNSFDLITVAQAYHWFNGLQFCSEATRVGRDDALVAIWVYDLAISGTSIDNIIRRWNFDALGPYWEVERNHVYNGYKDLPFEFERITTPEFQIMVEWGCEELIGHLRTWSALQKMMNSVGDEPFKSVIREIESAWGNNSRLQFRFPLTLLLGRIHK